MGEPAACRSELVAENRCGPEAVDLVEFERKRLKTQESAVLRSQDVADGRYHFSGDDMSCGIKERAVLNPNAAHVGRISFGIAPVLMRCESKQIDVSERTVSGFNPPRDVVQSGADVNQAFLLKNNEKVPYINPATAKGVGMQLEKETHGLVKQIPFFPPKNVGRAKCTDLLECGSTTGPVQEKDPLAVWKEMKQNGFLSSTQSHKAAPVLPPKRRARKSKVDVMKKKVEQAKIELAKKEQVDRFTKIAAPSGLLNGLNPGIINHVRNSRQVHSIIKALVRHEATGNKSSNHAKTIETNTRKELDITKNPGLDQFARHDDGFGNNLAENSRIIGHPLTPEFSHLSTKGKGADPCCHSAADADFGHQTSVVFPHCGNDGDILAMKSSSSIENVPDDSNFISNEDDQSCISSLSVKAASVASQMLELLQQDIKGRLAALRRSKKRVRAVIQTEMPFLHSKEFPSNQENEPYATKTPAVDSHLSTAVLHQLRWNSLFGQLDTDLVDEEKPLESLLEQVRQMQVHCDRGLHYEIHALPLHLQSLVNIENDPRLRKRNREMELAVQAAAAAIYSTSNFVVEKDNIMCSQTR